MGSRENVVVATDYESHSGDRSSHPQELSEVEVGGIRKFGEDFIHVYLSICLQAQWYHRGRDCANQSYWLSSDLWRVK